MAPSMKHDNGATRRSPGRRASAALLAWITLLLLGASVAGYAGDRTHPGATSARAVFER